MARDSRFGWLLVAAGAMLILAVQAWRPVGVPLYDGVVVQEPYRFLHPSEADEAGSPTSYAGTKPVAGDVSPIFAAATTENPPQAQLIAQSAAFTISPGATALQVSITPIDPPGPAPAGGAIAGNVYRFAVTDQAGTPLDVRQCAGCLSLLLRAPDGAGEATLKRFANGAWQNVDTIHAGVTGLYQANPTAMGEYAVVAITDPDAADGGLNPIVLTGGVAVIVLSAIGAFLLFGVRQAPREPEPAQRSRIPSKRKGPRR
jgi:hypothetical protein